MRKIWFSRHGESEYNMFAKIGGDSNISPQGQVYAKMLPDLLVDRVPLVRHQSLVTVLISSSCYISYSDCIQNYLVMHALQCCSQLASFRMSVLCIHCMS